MREDEGLCAERLVGSQSFVGNEGGEKGLGVGMRKVRSCVLVP